MVVSDGIADIVPDIDVTPLFVVVKIGMFPLPEVVGGLGVSGT